MMLTDQKRRLASMLASLQVEKSREVATLRGQLNALTKVEVNKYMELHAPRCLISENLRLNFMVNQRPESR